MPWQRSTPARNDAATATGDRLATAVVVDLVTRAKRGEGEAFGALYDHYVGEVYAFVAVRLVGREAAEDLTQTIFLRALHSLDSCREAAAFPGWLFAIARNLLTDHYRANRHRPQTLDETLDPEDPDPTPEEVIIQRDNVDILREARAHCLSAQDRELFDLLLTDLNDKQIAQALGRSHGAVRVAHHRLMSKLRECLEKLTGFARVRGASV